MIRGNSEPSQPPQYPSDDREAKRQRVKREEEKEEDLLPSEKAQKSNSDSLALFLSQNRGNTNISKTAIEQARSQHLQKQLAVEDCNKKEETERAEESSQEEAVTEEGIEEEVSSEEEELEEEEIGGEPDETSLFMVRVESFFGENEFRFYKFYDFGNNKIKKMRDMVDRDTISLQELLFKFTLNDPDFDISALKKDLKVDSSDASWRKCVIRSKFWVESPEVQSMYNLINSPGEEFSQKAYGEFMHETSIMGAKGVNEYGWGFDQVFHFCAFRRLQIALELKQKSKVLFGELIGSSGKVMKTKLTGIYRPLGVELFKRVENLSAQGVVKTEHYEIEENERAYILKTKVAIGEESIVLNKIIFPKIATQDNPRKHIILYHSPPENFNKVYPIMKEIFKKVVIAEDYQWILNGCGNIFFLGCGCKPFCRGDPSIFESIVRIVFLVRNKPNPPWKVGVIPWETTVLEWDRRAYSSGFGQLLEINQADIPSSSSSKSWL